MSKFKSCDRYQLYLLPPSIDEWLPENHLARFIVEVIEKMDLTRLTNHYSGKGSAAYHPAMMLSLLVYGYAIGTFSSRKIERATYDSVAFRFLAANQHPDHDTIAHFRKTFLVELEDLFVQVLVIAQAMKLFKLGNISLDGTKIKANASKHKALSHGHIEKLETQLREEVQFLLNKAVQTDEQESDNDLDLPAELARREQRLEALAAAKAKIEERVQVRDRQAQKDYEDKVARREAQRRAGQKPRGREPKAPETGPKAKDQINLTDEHSRIMPSSDGFIQGYNGQSAVDTESMLIVATDLTTETNDKQRVKPMLETLGKLENQFGKPDTLLADNGYFSQDNVKSCAEHGITPLIALGREAHHLPIAQRLQPDAPEPQTDDPLERMVYQLKTQSGRELYGKRKSTVEPVFGIIKQVLGFRQFLLRGFQAAAGEWKLVAMAYNFKRIHTMVATMVNG